MPETTLKCAVCDKAGGEGIEIKKCGRCKSRAFCSVACQRQDWPSHKAACNAQRSAGADNGGSSEGGKWYDRYRKCEDGSSHFGELELITWEGADPQLGEPMGWGNCLASESADMRRRYEVEFGCDDRKMYKYWRQAYSMGKPLPDSIYNEPSMERHGLRLSRGPDKRSFSPMQAAAAEAGRSVLGMLS
ncbi:hypothetical protein SLS62_002853 [Diatrype stigma]|uniref:MYND-type domain-containing protein n=1 Tax=Diatrype stigma TaxID=117547 RepID=A0AAN9UVL0_9PEZI